MFTGIIETIGTVKEIITKGGNKVFWITSPITPELKVDQSLAHNGVCLTVEEINGNAHRITAIHETLIKTNLGDWKPGDIVNLERSMLVNGRLDGHFVQGHVDATATCTSVVSKDGSWEYSFSFDEKFGPWIIEKGSISLNGISLTIFNVGKNNFTVGIVPYTFEHTNMKLIQKNDIVNIEFDVLGKYATRFLEFEKSATITDRL